MLEGLLEGLVTLLAEVGFNVVVEVLAELGAHAFLPDSGRRPGAVVAVVGYVLCGAALGCGSSYVVPELVIRHETLAMVNLAMSPVFAGLTMMAIGAARARRGQSLIRLDSFFYGWLFAAAFVLTRYAMVTG